MNGVKLSLAFGGVGMIRAGLGGPGVSKPSVVRLNRMSNLS